MRSFPQYQNFKPLGWKGLKCEEFEQNCAKSHKYEMMKDDEKDKVSTNWKDYSNVNCWSWDYFGPGVQKLQLLSLSF